MNLIVGAQEVRGADGRTRLITHCTPSPCVLYIPISRAAVRHVTKTMSRLVSAQCDRAHLIVQRIFWLAFPGFEQRHDICNKI